MDREGDGKTPSLHPPPHSPEDGVSFLFPVSFPVLEAGALRDIMDGLGGGLSEQELLSSSC